MERVKYGKRKLPCVALERPPAAFPHFPIKAMKVSEFQQRQALDQIAEIKRILAAAIHGMNNQVPGSILITSAEQEEGKSLVAAALAASAARSGDTRVAILDANWFRPALHRFFNLDTYLPMRQLFEGELQQLVRPIQDSSLDILTAPSDYSTNATSADQINLTIKRIIEQAKNSYGLTIIDSGALFPTNRFMVDPVMMSSIVTGVILVVKSGSTARHQVKKAIKTMETTGAKVLGVVSNHWQLPVGGTGQ